MKIPAARRPALSGYVKPDPLLPWRWVDARSYWITTRTRGFPSSRPVWGVWHVGTLLFSSGGLIARHVARDPRVQVNLESADELVIMEGLAAPLPETLAGTFSEQYNRKYHWDMPVSSQDVYQVRPVRVLAWMVDPSGLDGGSTFSNSATEWRFAQE